MIILKDGIIYFKFKMFYYYFNYDNKIFDKLFESKPRKNE